MSGTDNGTYPQVAWVPPISRTILAVHPRPNTSLTVWCDRPGAHPGSDVLAMMRDRLYAR